MRTGTFQNLALAVFRHRRLQCRDLDYYRARSSRHSSASQPRQAIFDLTDGVLLGRRCAFPCVSRRRHCAGPFQLMTAVLKANDGRCSTMGRYGVEPPSRLRNHNEFAYNRLRAGSVRAAGGDGAMATIHAAYLRAAPKRRPGAATISAATHGDGNAFNVAVGRNKIEEAGAFASREARFRFPPGIRFSRAGVTRPKLVQDIRAGQSSCVVFPRSNAVHRSDARCPSSRPPECPG